MSYKVRLTGGDEIKTDNATGEKLLRMIDTNKREGFFHSGRDLYMAKDVRSVVFLGEEVNEEAKRTAELEKIDKEYEVKLEKWSKEDVKTKTIREVTKRIKPLTQYIKPVKPLSELALTISAWFEKNPVYPWCPIEIWLEEGFGKKVKYPYYMNAISKHESRINKWLATKDINATDPNIPMESLVDEFMAGGDLDD